MPEPTLSADLLTRILWKLDLTDRRKLNLKAALENFGVIPENVNFGIKSSVVRTFLEGSDINLRHPNATEVSRPWPLHSL